MSERSAAEEHLRVIRSLMERATIYRAISAPVALFGGTMAVLLGFWPWSRKPAWMLGDDGFLACWLSVLAVTALANAYYIWREARDRGERFISSGMRLALRALLPPMLCGGVFTLAFGAAELPPFWMIFYGLGLLATAHFAPRSMVLLGWAFLLTGALAVLWCAGNGRLGLALHADLVMGFTFGWFHVIYAACTWPRRAAEVEAGHGG